MQYNNNGCSSLFNRNRGKKAAVPILRLGGYYALFVYLVAAFSIISVLSGCDESKEELVSIEEVVTNEDSLAINEEKEVIVHEISKEQDDKSGSCFVYVCGSVVNPDVYELKEDKHVIDAVKAAGGLTDEAMPYYLNLASPIVDGMKIYVPTKEEIDNNPSLSDQMGDSDFGLSDNENSGGKNLVNINEADAATLMTLPGIGQSKAEKIISYRENKGRFSKPEDIMLIDGIKNGLYDKIKDLICTQ